MADIFKEEEKLLRDRIRSLITAKNVADQQVSRSIGKSKAYISNILAGHSLPSIDAIFQLCDYLQISVKEFFDYSDENPTVKNDIVDHLERLLDADQLTTVANLMSNLAKTDVETILNAVNAISRANQKVNNSR